MNALKSICTTAILTLALAVSVAAGEISSPGYTAPPPPPPPPESNIVVEQSILTELISDEDPIIAPDVAIFWLLSSIF